MLLTIRDAVPDDLPAIQEVYAEAIASRSTAHQMLPELAEWQAWQSEHSAPARRLRVAERDGQFAGWATLSDYRKGRQALRQTAELTYYVAEQFQRRGVASGLVQDLITRAPQWGIQHLIAIVLSNNEPSLKFLERHRFEIWGTLPRVARIDGVEVDHIYLGLHLD